MLELSQLRQFCHLNRNKLSVTSLKKAAEEVKMVEMRAAPWKLPFSASGWGLGFLPRAFDQFWPAELQGRPRPPTTAASTAPILLPTQSGGSQGQPNEFGTPCPQEHACPVPRDTFWVQGWAPRGSRDTQCCQGKEHSSKLCAHVV